MARYPLKYGPEWVDRTRLRIKRANVRAFAIVIHRHGNPIIMNDQIRRDLQDAAVRVLGRAAKLGWIDADA